jgi:hypothetical protein
MLSTAKTSAAGRTPARGSARLRKREPRGSMLSISSGKTLACKEPKEEDSATRSILLLLHLPLVLSPTIN